MKNIIGFSLIALLVVISCKPQNSTDVESFSEQGVEGIWRLTEVDFTDDYFSKSQPKDRRRIAGNIGPGYIISLFPDSLATRLIDNKMEIMTWKLDLDSVLHLKNKNTADTLKLLKIETIEGFVFLKCKFNRVGYFTFHQEHKMLDKVEEDPYHPSNNKWRIPAKEYETQRQLNDRMRNYLDHYSYLLSSSMLRENGKIRLKNSKGILRIFDGGIGLVRKEDIPTDWLHAYFSDAQGYETYDRLNNHFNKNIIKHSSANGWIIDDLSIIDSLSLFFKN